HYTLSTRGNVALALYLRGRYQEALREMEAVLAVRKRRGEDDLDAFVNRTQRVWILARLGRLDRSGREAPERVELSSKRWGADNDLRGSVLSAAGFVLERNGRLKEALERNKEAIPILQKGGDLFELPDPLIAEPRLLRLLGRLPE